MRVLQKIHMTHPLINKIEKMSNVIIFILELKSKMLTSHDKNYSMHNYILFLFGLQN